MGKTHPIMIGNKQVGEPITRCVCADCGITQYSPSPGIWFVRIKGVHGFMWGRQPTPEPVCSICRERFLEVRDPRSDIDVSTPTMFSIPQEVKHGA